MLRSRPKVTISTTTRSGDDGESSGIAGWHIERVTGAFPTAVSFWLAREDGDAKIQILVGQRGEAECLKATPLGDVSYRQFSGIGEREAAKVTLAFANGLEAGNVPVARYFPHLSTGADVADDQSRLRLERIIQPAIPLLGDAGSQFREVATRAKPTTLIFDPPGIAEFLEPEIAVDGMAILGWVFRGVYLPSVARRESADFSTFMLEFTRDDSEQAARLTLKVDGNDTKAFGRCGRLCLGIAHDGEVDTVPVEVASLASWIVALLRIRSSAELDIEVATALTDLRAISYPARTDAIETQIESDESGDIATVTGNAKPPALNLALDPECGQRCVFCSVKSYVTPTDAGDTDLNDVLVQLDQARQRGVGEVRLNGIDPLRHSRVLEVVDAIRDAGFPALTVFSTARRLAEDDFRKAFLDRVPRQFEIFIPLYGLSAEVHDIVTGTPGAYREVQSAIDGLRKDGAGDAIRISTIFVQQNVHEIVPMLRKLRSEGVHHVDAHLPYPMRPTTRDPYVDSAVREADLLDRLLADLETIPEDDGQWALPIITGAFRHPCIAWRAESRGRVPALGAAFPERAFPLAGTEYRSDQFVHASGTAGEGGAFAVAVVDCPHTDRCALAPVCPREHYSVYAEHYGLEEFEPVHPSELYQAKSHRRQTDDSPVANLWSGLRSKLRGR